jgi:hypothetical protein
MSIRDIVVRAQRCDHGYLESFLTNPRMHETPRLSALDELGDALFEPTAQDHLALDVESKLFHPSSNSPARLKIARSLRETIAHHAAEWWASEHNPAIHRHHLPGNIRGTILGWKKPRCSRHHPACPV